MAKVNEATKAEPKQEDAGAAYGILLHDSALLRKIEQSQKQDLGDWFFLTGPMTVKIKNHI